MSKRCSVDAAAGDLEDICDYKRLPKKRPKMFTHETEQFPLCASVGELQLHMLVAQNKKLVDCLEQRKKVEDHLRGIIENLEGKKRRDDEIVACVGRFWKQIATSVNGFLIRLANDSHGKGATDCIPIDNEQSFIAQIAQMNQADVEQLLLGWAQTATDCCAEMTSRIKVIGDNGERVCQLLEQCKMGASGECLMEMKEIFNACGAFIDSRNLRQQVDELQAEKNRCQLQASDLLEKVAVLNIECEELRSRTADAEARVEYWIRREEKYKLRISDLRERVHIAEHQAEMAAASLAVQSTVQVAQNGPGDAEATASCKAADEKPSVSNDINDTVSEEQSKSEEDTADTRRDIAEIRLAEVRVLTKQLLAAQKTIDTLRHQLNHCPDSVIRESSLFRTKLYQTRMLIIELNRFAQFSRQAKVECNQMTNQYQQFFQHCRETLGKKDEDIVSMITAQTERFNSIIADVVQQLEKYTNSLSGACKSSENNDPSDATSALSVSAVMDTLKRQLKQTKGEGYRWRRKYDEANAQVTKLHSRLEQQHLRLKSSILVPLVNGHGDSGQNNTKEEDGENKEPGELEESDVEDDEMKKMQPLERVAELKKRLLRYKKTCSRLAASLEAAGSLCDKTEASEKLTNLLVENGQLRHYVRAMHKRHFANVMPELHRLNKVYEEEIVRLKRTIEECKKEEQTVLVEAESTGQAYDQALDENCALQEQLAQCQAAVTSHIMQASRTAVEMQSVHEQMAETRRRLKLLEQKISLDEKKLDLCNEKERLSHLSMAKLQKENQLLAEQVRAQDWTTLDIVNKAISLNCTAERLEDELNQIKEALQSSVTALENERLTRSQAEEQLQLLRRKVDKMKKYAVATAGNVGGRPPSQDEVLCEENRHLKELLTCPSCKVNRKDATLVKCFHVFCSPCLKKRYESRQRKCPKCAQTFGLNDIKKIFIL